MLPALTQALRELRDGFGSEPITLDLKETISFDATEAAKIKRIFPRIYGDYLGPVWSGETVSENSALNHSVVWACNRVISETLASLPLHLMQKNGESRRLATDVPAYKLLHDEPNEWQSDMEWREGKTGRVVLGGNGYSRIIRRPSTGDAIAFYPINGYVRSDFDASNRLVYLVKDGNAQEQTFTVERDKPHDILHVRGLSLGGIDGVSVIHYARQSIGTAQAAEKFSGKFYANGGRLPYVLKLDKPFKNDHDFERFRADWEATYSEPHKAPILLPGMEYQQIGLNAKDAQFLETRQFNIPEICRWFRISPHLVGDLSRATFSNIEHLAIEFVTQTLMAWMVRWEKAIYRCVLTPKQKEQGFYVKHNINALLRGDIKSRMEAYAQALQAGILNIDEVRELEERNPLPDDIGKAHHVNAAMATLPLPTATELAEMSKVDGTSAKPMNGTSE